jgi:uncharacterized iron-regulated membrane protein
MSFRPLLLKLHLIVGLTIGLFLLVVALSGASLVFEDNLDRALTPALSYVTPGARVLPVSDLIARIKAKYLGALVGSVSFPESPDQSMMFGFRTKAQGSASVYVNQYTGDVLGVRTPDERERGLARRLHVLHTSLFAGQVGKWIVGTITALTLLMAISGLCLWWPRKILSVMTRASWRRVNFDLHNVFGLYASAAFLFIALTGLMIAFEGVTDPMISRLNAAPQPEPPRQSTVVKGAAPLSVDAVADIARAALPGAFLKNISVPNGGKAVVTAGMKFPEDRTPGGRSRVFIDQYSGTVLTVLNTRTAPLGTRIINVKRSAHTGDIFGATTQAIYFMTCLMLAGQIVTGFFIWWKPRRNGAVRTDARARESAA